MFISASHDRCSNYKIKATQKYSKRILSEKEFFSKTEENRELILAAVPIMNKIYDFVKGSNFFLILTDKDGCILNVIGDEDILSEAFSFKMIPGAYMNEQSIGTNAMGTCLTEKKPLQVSGDQHFVNVYHRWTCSASPISDSSGNIIGALDLTGYSASVHQHTLGIVVAGAKAIENELAANHYRMLLMHEKSYIDIVHSSLHAGIITSDPKGNIIEANPYSAELLGYSEEKIRAMNMDGILKNWKDISESVIKNKTPFRGDVDIISPKNRLQLNLIASHVRNSISKDDSIVFIFNEVKKQRKMIDKIMSGRAIYTFDKIVGKDENFLNVVNFAKKIADSRSNILILGESGTGKELFAQSIHNYSDRADEPFIALNCGAIPRSLIESELFGYEEGSFTGAKSKGNTGKFEAADGGTIFLDEIGEMPFDLQTRLLRVIEEGSFNRIGSSKEIVVDVRIIAATNKKLSMEVENGTFRKDLYYRLNVLPLRLPALSERKGDIKLLLEYFMDKISRKLNKKKLFISEDKMKVLMQYDWPGNIRELENYVELAVNTETVPDIYELYKGNTAKPDSYKAPTHDDILFSLKDLEKEHIIKALKATDNNVTQSAHILGIGRNTLYRKLKEYGIDCYITEHSSKTERT